MRTFSALNSFQSPFVDMGVVDVYSCDKALLPNSFPSAIPALNFTVSQLVFVQISNPIVSLSLTSAELI